MKDNNQLKIYIVLNNVILNSVRSDKKTFIYSGDYLIHDTSNGVDVVYIDFLRTRDWGKYREWNIFSGSNLKYLLDNKHIKLVEPNK